MISKVLNACRMSNPPTSHPEPGKNRWFTKGSESEGLPKGHKSELWTPLHKGVPFKGFREKKGHTRLKPNQKKVSMRVLRKEIESK